MSPCCFIILNIYSAGFSSTRGLFLFSLYAHEWHINVVLAFSHTLHICLSTNMDVGIMAALQTDGSCEQMWDL